MPERKLNVFEKMLLFVGSLVIIIGYVFLHGMLAQHGLSWQALQTVFLWLLLVVVIILAAVTENMKEELKTVIDYQLKEIKLLRDDFKRHNR